MFGFAILLLGGALTLKVVDMIGHLSNRKMRGASAILVSAVVGIGIAYLFEYSVFATWNIDVRSTTLGLVGTGLFMSALADAWREMLAVVHEWAHRYRGEASEIEARLSRAA